MRKLLTIGLSMSLLAAVALSAMATQDCNQGCAGNGPPVAGPTEVLAFLSFDSADQTHSFTVDKAQKAGTLTVDTLDCCISGDCWKVTLDATQPSNQSAEGVGDGNTSTYSGAASVGPWVHGTVTVSYDHGVDVFPAGMTVRFTYSQHSNNNTGINVSQID